MKRGNTGSTLLVVALIIAANVVEQMLFGIQMIEFYFGLSLSELHSLSPIMRMGVSLSPIGFVVVPAIIGAVYMHFGGSKPYAPPFALALSFFGHCLYVVLVVILHAAIDMYLVTIGVNFVLLLILIFFFIQVFG